ncbi:hypothetical protein TH0156_00540 [Helicobacter pylori]
MSGAHIVENTNNEKIENTNISKTTASTPPDNEELSNNEELLKSVKGLADGFKKLNDKLEDLEHFVKISRCIGRFFRKSSNDTQENSKDTQKREEALKKVQEENTKLNRERNDLDREKNKLASQNTALAETNQKLTTEKDNLNNQLNASQKQVKELEQSQQALKNEKAELSKDKENLTKEKTELTEKNKALTTEKDNLTKANAELKTEKESLNTDLSKTKKQVSQANQEKDKLEQKHATYKKLERLYEIFLEVKGCLNFSFVEKTHSAMDLIAYVLSDSKYYLESLYNKASQELSDKKSDKGEKLAELFDSLFEYVKDNKFERLKEPSAYDSTCKSLYP